LKRGLDPHRREIDVNRLFRRREAARSVIVVRNGKQILEIFASEWHGVLDDARHRLEPKVLELARKWQVPPDCLVYDKAGLGRSFGSDLASRGYDGASVKRQGSPWRRDAAITVAVFQVRPRRHRLAPGNCEAVDSRCRRSLKLWAPVGGRPSDTWRNRIDVPIRTCETLMILPQLARAEASQGRPGHVYP
jgi:hypothetical protein